MTEGNKRLSRRDAMKAGLGGAGAVIGLGFALDTLGILNVSGPRSAFAENGQAQPRLGDGLFVQKASQVNSLEAARQTAVQELGLPENWPQTPDAAASMFGGKKEYWRKDLYVDQADGQVKWDSWVMDAYALKTPFNADGAYVDASGKPMSEDQIFDFSQNVDHVDVDFGEYADSFKAHGTSWDGKMYKAGYGHAVFNKAVQAVMRPVNAECIPGGDIKAFFKGLAWELTAQEFSKYLASDKNADNLVAGLWIEDMNRFKLVQGKGWA